MEHTRIDEGVPRKRRRRQGPLRRDPESGMVQAIPDDLDPHAVLQMYLSAETTASVARELGVKRSSLLAWIKEKAPEEWKAVQIIRAHIKREDGDAGLYDSCTSLELSRAREVLRSGQWDLERLDPANWGPKQEITTHIQPILNITLVAAPGYPQAASIELPKKEADLAIDVNNQEDAI